MFRMRVLDLNFYTMEMLMMVYVFQVFFLCFLGLTAGAGQESFELLTLYDTNSDMLQPRSSGSYRRPIAVSLDDKNLREVSTSVLMAETWLRNYVLAHYPSSKITTIVASHSLLCHNDQENNLGLVLTSLKNLYHSLTRWGLEKDIKVSVNFSFDCLNPNSVFFKDEFAGNVVKSLLQFLQSVNSTFSVHPLDKFLPLSEENVRLLSSRLVSMKKLGSFNNVNVIIAEENHTEKRLESRKLSFMETKLVDPYLARPSPLPEISPLHSSIGFSAPANIAKNPHGAPIPQPPLSFPLVSPPPMFIPPADSPYSFSLPPCNPVDSPAPAPAVAEIVQRLWCVAKPSVPAERLQEGLDYACGYEGVDCEGIKPEGKCFYPDTLVAHASYAFNSYWQKTKRHGGTCSFGGTAMIINADPSYLECRFVLR